MSFILLYEEAKYLYHLLMLEKEKFIFWAYNLIPILCPDPSCVLSKPYINDQLIVSYDQDKVYHEILQINTMINGSRMIFGTQTDLFLAQFICVLNDVVLIFLRNLDTCSKKFKTYHICHEEQHDTILALAKGMRHRFLLIFASEIINRIKWMTFIQSKVINNKDISTDENLTIIRNAQQQILLNLTICMLVELRMARELAKELLKYIRCPESSTKHCLASIFSFDTVAFEPIVGEIIEEHSVIVASEIKNSSSCVLLEFQRLVHYK